MWKFSPVKSQGVVLVAILAAVTLAPLVNPMIRAEAGPTPHHFVPTTVELPASDADPAPTF